MFGEADCEERIVWCIIQKEGKKGEIFLKKSLALLLILCLLGALCACTAPEASSTPMPSATVTPSPTPVPTPSPTPEPTPGILSMEGRDPLTGLPYAGPYQPVLVMINNDSTASRPQSGMEAAGWVYECYIEGKGTRYMAIYNAEKPEKVGPVRSCRVYYARLARGWDGFLVHCGGAETDTEANVYNLFKSLGLRDRLDGNSSDKHFTRATDRKAPHNLYVNLKAASDESYAKNTSEVPLPGYQFGTLPIEGTDAKEISLAPNGFTKIKYVYNAETDLYARYENDAPDADKEDGKGIQCANIIIQRAKHSSFDTAGGHINVGVIGEGEATFFLAGKQVEGTWKKADASSQTKYYTADGEELILRPGATWVQIVDSGVKVSAQ